MRSYKLYLGTGFEVWKAQQTWFWFVINHNPDRSGGVIGAAASEAEAVREASWLIEEALASLEETSAPRRGDAAVLFKSRSFALAAWERSLENLERYLARLSAATAQGT